MVRDKRAAAVVLYIDSMWIAGVMQGLMWRAVNDDGTLTYSFVESLEQTYQFYFVRLLGGALVLGPVLIGLERPVQIAQVGAAVGDIITLAAMAAYELDSEHRSWAEKTA